jgi:hypothetical protein
LHVLGTQNNENKMEKKITNKYNETHKNQLLALDKENNTIHTTIHTNLLVESFYTTPNGSNNNLYSDLNEYNSNNTNNDINIQQSMASPVRENSLIDTTHCTENCNRGSCNQLCTMNTSDVGGNNNDACGKWQNKNKSHSIDQHIHACILSNVNSIIIRVTAFLRENKILLPMTIRMLFVSSGARERTFN